MRTRAELKAMAKEQIKGNLGPLFVISLIVFGITYVASLLLSLIAFGNLIVSIVISPAFSLSTVYIYLALVNFGQKPQAADAFKGFNDFFTAFKANFLASIYVFLWSLLLIIPGIIKSYSYSMILYIVAENPGISAKEALKRSKEMMEGHKMEYFVLGLSFSGWILVTVLTFGIAGIWTIPYMNATMANFYNEIKPLEAFYAEANPEQL